MSVVTGDAVTTIKNLDDKQVLQQCMTVLRELFKEQVREAASTKRWINLPTNVKLLIVLFHGV